MCSRGGRSDRRSPLVWATATCLLAGPSLADVWFHEITAEVGLPVELPERPAEVGKVPDVMTSGCAFFDYDADGDLDVYLSNPDGLFDDSGLLPEPANRLYRQEADGSFTDVTAASGVAHFGYGIGVGIGDYDNDGYPDLYAANFADDVLFRNRGDGTFEDVTEAAGISVDGWSCSTAFFDHDGDGFLDLFITQYVFYDDSKTCTDNAGRPDFCGPRAFPPAPDFLLHNNGDGTFTDVSEAAGIRTDSAAGLGVISEDLNGDGLSDLYVTNDSYPNHLWINQGDGTFFDEALILGAALNEHGSPEAGMGIVAADFDNDRDFDLFMTHLKRESNTIYENLGPDLGFEDATSSTGLGTTSMPWTGFGTVAFDVELDGDLDLFIANGAVNRSDPLPGVEVGHPWNLFAEPNQLYLNDGTGRFELLEDGCGTLCSRVEMTRGVAAGDYDADGDLDLLLANSHSPSRLYRNDAPRRGSWLVVRAVDPALRRDAIGAVVEVRAGEKRYLRRITHATSYLSSGDARAHFGLGGLESIDSITVVWPGGEEEEFDGGPVDRVVELVRGSSGVGS